ncbi:MAG: galactose mutarotase [Thomasclavelia sp.]|jgi:aldose 1-epimerase|nr:galactose mutarotase [Thomasclavelia sp.]
MIKVIKDIDENIKLISLSSKKLEVVVSNYGATIVKVLLDDKDGIKRDVVLGYDDFSKYQTLDACLGACVGRVANRIGKATFTLDGVKYDLVANNGPNCIHGGIKGFAYQIFDYAIDNNRLILTYISKDNEEGFPGEMVFKVIYEVVGDTLRTEYLATSTKDTLINITNHSYFNLSGKPEIIDDHILEVKASKFAYVDNDGLPTGEIKDVTNTPFDFRKPTRIGDQIHKSHPQLTIGKGFDHPFIFDEKENQVTLYNKDTGIELIVSTSLPQAQIYTANYLDGRVGKYNDTYPARSAVCIETQNMPDDIHLANKPKTILKKGKVYNEYTSYTFKTR